MHIQIFQSDYSRICIRFAEGAEFLRATETADELRERFETERPLLANILKKKLRARAKRQDEKLKSIMSQIAKLLSINFAISGRRR